MKLFLTTIAILFLQSIVFAQQFQQRDSAVVDLDSVNLRAYSNGTKVSVDEWPRFKGNNSNFDAYIRSHLMYPVEARQRSIEGAVYVSYIIDTNGKVKDVRVIQSSSSLLDKAAIDVIAHSPKWKPGRYKGKPVRIKNISKVVFSL